jgi:hypothetical protein
MNLMLYLQRWKNHVFTRNNLKKGRRGKIKIKFPIYSCLELRGITENGQYHFVAFNNDNYSTEHPALSIDEKHCFCFRHARNTRFI